MKQEYVKNDITVIGGGLAGVCAAVAAARLGQTVALIQNRPVLGGNSSSEVRVWVCGATAHGKNRYARETGIMGEMFVENQYRNPEGNPYYWDLVVLETVKAEKNITLYLNTDVHEVDASGPEDDRVIHSVTGWMMASERKIRFESDIFLDCTGDGLVGFLAGAKFRIGREAKQEFNEAWAPEIADDITLGSTILFYTKDVGHPVKYVPPSFAIDITKTSIPMRRVIRSGDNGCSYWWIEWGGEHDTVHDNERIRDELWGAIYGIWDYIKNSGSFDADNMTLEWVGAVPGKREYRRFIGDYILNQNDILAQREFEDRVAFGGWSIDLHPPQGMYAEASGSKHLFADGNYHIPFRSLYSANTRNLMFAGRNVSASHVAFGTTRVMATCAVMGEAAGTGAALCVQEKTTPRGVYENHLDVLQQTLLRQDAAVLGLRNTDFDDHAKRARISASSTVTEVAVKPSPESDRKIKLDLDQAISFPVDPKLEAVELLVDVLENTNETEIVVELYHTGKPQNYIPSEQISSQSVRIPEGERQWVRIPLEWNPSEAQNGFLVIKANSRVNLYMTNRYETGVLSYSKETREDVDPLTSWKLYGKNGIREQICVRIYPETKAYAAEKIIDGYVRPYGGPHMWRSDSLENDVAPWIQLDWDHPIRVQKIDLTFNDDVNEDLINLHHHRTSFESIPELVKNYHIEVLDDEGKWQTLIREQDNRKRKRKHQLSEPIETRSMRLVITATQGGAHAEVIEVRVY